MIDLNNIGQYRENNRIEAKRALGGLPHSIWETYSAFANTLGGIILLGVEEHDDHSLHPIDLPEPEGLVAEFWNAVSDPAKASANVLSPDDIAVEAVDGKHIIVIRVPRAERAERPVYLDGDTRNTYRRSGEGDYRCEKAEVETMLRDASARTPDGIVLEEFDGTAFSAASVAEYRRRMAALDASNPLNALPDGEFLRRVNALSEGPDGTDRPTCAGLLFFGNGDAIRKAFPRFGLVYTAENGAEAQRPAEPENVFGFYCRVSADLAENALPPAAEGSDTVDLPAVRQAVSEALLNALVNADYFGAGGVTVARTADTVTMENPGLFRIAIDRVRSGGLSDPRNGIVMKLFNRIGIGDRSGSGIPNLFRVWHEQGWAEPSIAQSFRPDRTVLTLCFRPPEGGASPERENDKARKETIKAIKKQMIIEYLTDHASATAHEIADHIETATFRAGDYLAELVRDGIVTAEDGAQKRIYRLKRKATL